MKKNKDTRSTSELFRMLSSTEEIHEFIHSNTDELSICSFPVSLAEICNSRGLIPEQVIKRSLIERTYGHQLFNGTRKPSRDKVLQLAIGLGLTLDETQSLLRSARKNLLYPRIKRDAAIIFCLNKHLDILDSQNLLESLQISLLGEE